MEMDNINEQKAVSEDILVDIVLCIVIGSAVWRNSRVGFLYVIFRPM